MYTSDRLGVCERFQFNRQATASESQFAAGKPLLHTFLFELLAFYSSPTGSTSNDTLTRSPAPRNGSVLWNR